MIVFSKAGTSTSGNRGHAGLPGRRGGSAPTRNIVNSKKITIKANSKLASQLDSALRETPVADERYFGSMVYKGSSPEEVVSLLTKQQGFDGANQLTTDKTKVGNIVFPYKKASSGELDIAINYRKEELKKAVASIENAHLASNPDLSNLKNKEWKEKKLELAIISSSREAYAIMNGYDAIDDTQTYRNGRYGELKVLNQTKVNEFDHRSYLANEKAKNDQTQNETLSKHFSAYLNSGEMDMDMILDNPMAQKFINEDVDYQGAIKEAKGILLQQSGFGYQPIMEHSNNFIESMTENEQLIFRGVDTGSVSVEKMHNDFETEMVTSDSWRPSGVVGEGYYGSRLERAIEYADGSKSYYNGYTTTDSSRRLNTRDDYNHGKTKVDGFASDNSPEQRVHALKIDKSKMMNVDTFAKMQRSYVENTERRMADTSLSPKERRKAKLLYGLASNEYTFAMMTGVDGVYMPDDMSGEPPHFAVYNRTAIKTTRLNYLMDYHSTSSLNDLSKFNFGDGSWK